MIDKDRKYMELAPEDFPLSLSQSKFMPKRLYGIGTLPEKEAVGIAMVGTRRPSSSAKELCRRLVNKGGHIGKGARDHFVLGGRSRGREHSDQQQRRCQQG